jgi:hypothetical protein
MSCIQPFLILRRLCIWGKMMNLVFPLSSGDWDGSDGKRVTQCIESYICGLHC